MKTEINAIPDDAVLMLRDWGWGKSKQSFDKVFEVAGLNARYGKPEFGKPVICTVSNGSGEWVGEGRFPVAAYCRAVARFVFDTKFHKKQVA